MSETNIARRPRWSTRHNFAEICVLDWTSEDTCHGWILDVSEGGACFRGNLPLPVGHNVELRIRLADTLFEVLANVRWCHGGGGVWETGLMFLEGEAGPDSDFGQLLLLELAQSVQSEG